MSKEPKEILEALPSTADHVATARDDLGAPDTAGAWSLRDMLDALDRVAASWESVIGSVLESHASAVHVVPEPRQPLPQWAVDRLRNAGAYGEAGDRYRQYRTMLQEALRLASGEGSNYRYEVWDPRPHGRFVRLERRSETLMEARERQAQLAQEFPKAFVAQVHVQDAGSGVSDPALLDTLVGRLWHAGTAFLKEGDAYEIQDSTGRTVMVDAAILRAHPCFERLSVEAKESVEHSLARRARRKAAAEKGGEA